MADIFDRIQNVAGIALLGALAYGGYRVYKSFTGELAPAPTSDSASMPTELRTNPAANVGYTFGQAFPWLVTASSPQIASNFGFLQGLYDKMSQFVDQIGNPKPTSVSSQSTYTSLIAGASPDNPIPSIQYSGPIGPMPLVAQVQEKSPAVAKSLRGVSATAIPKHTTVVQDNTKAFTLRGRIIDAKGNIIR